MSDRALSIFIAHPSAVLTDHRPNGDGLVAFGFLKELSQRGHRLHVAAQSVDLLGKLPDNVTIHSMSDRSANTFINRVEYMRRLKRLLTRLRSQERIEIIHQLNPVDVGMTSLLGGCGLPIVLGPYVPDWPDEKEDHYSLLAHVRQRATKLLKTCIQFQQQRGASALLLSTPAARSKVKASRPIYYLTPGIDTTVFAPAPPRLEKHTDGPQAADDAPSILFLANLVWKKGVLTLLDAFELVVRALPSCQLTIAGSGPALEVIRRRLARSSYGSRITLTGAVPRSRVARVMRESTVYCLPSYGEPFGMTALEAMACGKPVVGTDAGGLRYLLPDQGSVKVAPRDPAALAAALTRILRSPAAQRKMGAYNRQLVEATYSWERVGQRLEEVYREVLSEPAGFLPS